MDPPKKKGFDCVCIAGFFLGSPVPLLPVFEKIILILGGKETHAPLHPIALHPWKLIWILKIMLSNRSLLIQGSIFRCQFAFQLPSKLHGINANPPWLVTKDFSSFPVGNSRNVKTSGIRWGLKEFLGRISYDIQKNFTFVLRFPYIKLPDMSGFWIRTAKTNCWWLYLLPMINQHCGALEAWPKIPKKKPNKNHPSTLGMQKFEEGKFHQEAKSGKVRNVDSNQFWGSSRCGIQQRSSLTSSSWGW